jgi:nucleoside-diphosphate-sugar epimerase
MTTKALITGASGFIGSHLTELLLERGWQVTCLLRLKSKMDFLDEKRIHIIRGDMEDIHLLERSVEGQEYVFHLAARIRSTNKAAYDRANHLLTRNLLQACLSKNPGIKRFVYVSSISAAGPSPPGIFVTENDTPSPNSEYGRTKLKGEMVVREKWEDIPATIIRPPNVYGPRLPEVEQIMGLLKKRIVPVLKDRGKVTSLVYFHDLVHGILDAALCPKANKQVYFLTDGEGYSWRDAILAFKKEILGRSVYLPFPERIIVFFAWMTDILKKLGLIKTHFGRRAWRAMVRTTWLFSTEKAKKDFGFQPRYSLQEGIKETVDHYRQIGHL